MRWNSSLILSSCVSKCYIHKSTPPETKTVLCIWYIHSFIYHIRFSIYNTTVWCTCEVQLLVALSQHVMCIIYSLKYPSPTKNHFAFMISFSEFLIIFGFHLLHYIIYIYNYVWCMSSSITHSSCLSNVTTRAVFMRLTEPKTDRIKSKPVLILGFRKTVFES